MEKITIALRDLANDLDKHKMSKVAAFVDKVNEKSLNVKKAQYEGIQGYWIRNRRCWENCYRQKRAKKDIPAQEVWMECHAEYVKSIGRDTSDWDKYANDSGKLVKLSSKRINKKNYVFAHTVKEKTELGLDLPSAIFETIDSELFRYSQELQDQANNMSKVASYLHDKKKFTLAKKAASAAEMLAKEAQFTGSQWNPMNWLQNTKANRGNLGSFWVKRRLKRVLDQANALRNKFPQDMSYVTDPTLQSELEAEYTQLQNNMTKELNQINKITSNNEQGQGVYNAVSGPFEAFVKDRRPRSRRRNLDELVNTLVPIFHQSSDGNLTEQFRQTPLTRNENQPRQQQPESSQSQKQQMSFDWDAKQESAEPQESVSPQESQQNVEQIQQWIDQIQNLIGKRVRLQSGENRKLLDEILDHFQSQLSQSTGGASQNEKQRAASSRRGRKYAQNVSQLELSPKARYLLYKLKKDYLT